MVWVWVVSEIGVAPLDRFIESPADSNEARRATATDLVAVLLVISQHCADVTLGEIQMLEISDAEGSRNAAFSREVYDLVGKRSVCFRRHDATLPDAGLGQQFKPT